ncbi:unnamed protein product [Adineta ricciae]|uniref:Uncharacterized protein n=1 Tax=Adineta ricciae TaxID=249248 RepID=A0A814FRP8_ADIRI|nr:unnamed protein product [Adineta ricciae]
MEISELEKRAGIDENTINLNTIPNINPEGSIPYTTNIRLGEYMIEKIKKAGLLPLWNLLIHSVCTFGSFLIVSMIVGILIVCYTTPKPSVPKCELKFNRIDPNPVKYKYGPRSVATGDFNKDTWIDMVVVNNAVDSITVYFGNSNIAFQRQMQYSTGPGSSPRMVVVNDLNNDHQLDIIVANFRTHNLGIFLGFGNGSFANQLEISTGVSRPASITIADMNNDTLLDIVTANYGTHSVSIFYAYGNGRFSNSVSYSIGYDAQPISLITGDFNNDNYVDIAVANYDTHNIVILYANNKSTFENQVILSTGLGSHPCSIAAGYINDDSFLDIVVANYGTNSAGMFLSNFNGTFTNQQTFSLGKVSPYAIALGDFNRDNNMDIAITNQGANNIGILLGSNTDKNISTSSIKYYSTGSLSSIMFTIVDLNGDNRLDIIVVSNDTGSIDVLLGYFEGFPDKVTYSTDSSPTSVVVGDLNNDNRLDIVVANAGSDNVSVFLGNADGSFVEQVTYVTGFNPTSVIVGDLNNDTRLDIVVTNADSNNVGILIGLGNGSFADQVTYSTGSNPVSVTIGDLNNDARLDIVVANADSNTTSVLLGHGNGSFADQVTYSTGSNPVSVTIGDLNNDTRLDLVVANAGSNSVSILLGHGNGSFANQVTYSTGSYPVSVILGDLNNDTRLDIVVANRDANTVSILLGLGNGSFADQVIYSAGFYPSSAIVGDLNNDARLDIIVTNYYSNNVSILLGLGNGSFAERIPYSVGIGPWSVAVNDFNSDRQMDIVVGNAGSNNISVLLGHGNGYFENQIMYSSGGFSSGLAVHDLNNDSHPDVVITNPSNKCVSILLGQSNEVFVPQTTLTTANNSRPRALAIADFNNDNHSDIVVANSGTNDIGIFIGHGDISFTNQSTYSTGPNSSPYSVAVGDFNRDSYVDIVVTNYGTDTIGIFLGRGGGNFTNQTTYSTNVGSRPYSLSVIDFNNDTFLDIIVATYDDNNQGIFLGYGDGTFDKFLVVGTDYGSHPFLVSFGDFNNDKKMDFVVANEGTDSLSILVQTC